MPTACSARQSERFTQELGSPLSRYAGVTEAIKKQQGKPLAATSEPVLIHTLGNPRSTRIQPTESAALSPDYDHV